MTKRVLITGGAGYLGIALISNLVRQAKTDVYVVDNLVSGKREYLEPLLNRLAGVSLGRDKGSDIRDTNNLRNLINQWKPNVIVHIAAMPFIPDSFTNYAPVFDINVLGFASLLMAIKENRYVEKVIITSTAEVYGNQLIFPISEEANPSPQSPYAESKLLSEYLLKNWSLATKKPYLIFRLFNTYGIRWTQPYIVPEILHQLYSDSPTLKLGENTIRDMHYVDDCVQAIAKGIEEERANNQIINLGSGKGYEVFEIAKMLMDVTGIHKPIDFDASRCRPREVYKLIADTSKASRILNWKAITQIETGLKIVTNWYVEKSN